MTLPYRPNVGIALFNAAGLVFAGRGIAAGPEVLEPGREWQMPQGGVEPDEDIVAAAGRELAEETGVTAVSLLAVTPDWWSYDFPAYRGPAHPLCAFRGQQQRWVAFRFEDDERGIDVLSPPGGTPEFTSWDWFPLAELPRRVVSYKVDVYRRVAEAFAPYAASSRYPQRRR
ncbi:MAG: RNA pyrophosphohydrolase [Alsobacter sp.]|jgi:putative (di)nucleoside polyphosphate hydrolase